MKKTHPLTIMHSLLLCIIVLMVTSFFTIILNKTLITTTILANIPGFYAGIYSGIKLTGMRFNKVLTLKYITPNIFLGIVLSSIGIVIVLSEINNLIVYFFPMPKEIINMFKGIVIGIPGFVAVVIIAPITEELFFRGIILNGLLLIYKPIKSIFVSALLFGLIHLNPWQLLPAITAGVLIGWIYYKTNNILLCILIHGFNNASNYFMEKLEFYLPGLSYDLNNGVQFQPYWLNIVGLLLLIISILIINKNKSNCFE